MSNTLFGIKNCDTIKKAKRWLDNNNVEYHFHDVRADGLDSEQLDIWVAAVGWEVLLNKRGTTWRQLEESRKNNITESSAKAIMLEYPAIIKRPVLVTPNGIHVGFKEAEYQTLF